MHDGSTSETVEYTLGLLGHALGVLFTAAVPYAFGVVAAAGRVSAFGSPFGFAVSHLAASAVLLAGLGGLLYKVVADGVAAGRSTGETGE